MQTTHTAHFDAGVNRAGTHAVKWDYLKPLFGRDDVLPLWVADMDFPCPPGVVAALQERAAHPVYGYTLRSPQHFPAMLDWLARRHGWTVPEEACLHSPSVVTTLNLCVRTLTAPGEQVLLMPPVYEPFFRAIRDNGRELVECPLRQDAHGRYEMDFAGLDAACSRGVKLILFCHPHNPVGRVWHEDELAELARIALRHGTLVVSDEIHSDLILGPRRHVPLATLSEAVARNTISCISPSKTFNLAGLQASAIIATDPGVRHRLSHECATLALHHTNTFAATAFEAAYRTGEDWLAELLTYLGRNQSLIEEFLRSRVPRIRMRPSEGTYLAWLDCTNLGLTGRPLAKFFADQARVALEPGAKFGTGGEAHMRLNFASPRAVIAEALERIERAVSLLGP